MRNDFWLRSRLRFIWDSRFRDLKKKNRVKILFKGKWKNKFGHIKKKKNNSEIAINGLFKDILVPDYIIDLTIAHELVHYMHGFQSSYEKKFSYPHKGGIVRKELEKRGYKEVLREERKWVKDKWLKIYKLIS